MLDRTTDKIAREQKTCRPDGLMNWPDSSTRVLVDQPAQDGSAENPSVVEVGNDQVVGVVFTAGDALGDALVRPGRVVVHLILGQGGAADGLSPRISARSMCRKSTARIPAAWAGPPNA
jgi:hypothetical protein